MASTGNAWMRVGRGPRDLIGEAAGRLVRRRLAMGLTQSEVAYRAGVSASTVSRVERGMHLEGSLEFSAVKRALRLR